MINIDAKTGGKRQSEGYPNGIDALHATKGFLTWSRIAVAWLMVCATPLMAQIDPYSRSLLELGYDQSLVTQGPQTLYGFYYYNDPAFVNTNMALRLVVAPVYFDGEMGFRSVLPRTDVGFGLNGGGYGENYYEVRQGHFLKDQSFDGHGGGVSFNIYHLLNPGSRIPLSLVVQNGVHFSTYSPTSRTDDSFVLPDDRVSSSVRVGLRFAGKQPMLYEDLGMEISAWYQRQWRVDNGAYGFAGDRKVEPSTDLFWFYAGLNYAWTNSGNQVSFAMTMGGSEDADRFSAWRLGGVLPLASEYPLILPGYMYQEISARKFVHFNAAYVAPLSPNHRWQLRLEAATAWVDYLPGFEQHNRWNTGAGPSLSYTSSRDTWRIILRYGYAISAERSGNSDGQSAGLLYQYNFAARRHAGSGN